MLGEPAQEAGREAAGKVEEDTRPAPDKDTETAGAGRGRREKPFRWPRWGAWIAVAAVVAGMWLIVVFLTTRGGGGWEGETAAADSMTLVESLNQRLQARMDSAYVADSLLALEELGENHNELWGNAQQAIASAKQSILDRLTDKYTGWDEGNDLDGELKLLLKRYGEEAGELYGSSENPIDGCIIWHIGNDCWKPSLRFLSIEKETVPSRYAKVHLYKIAFELYYDTQRIGVKEIKVYRGAGGYKVWDIRADNAELSSSVWVREALTDYYVPHFA